MKVTDILKNADRPLVSFELTPPDKGESIKELEPTLERLVSFSPPFIDVTSRAGEILEVESEGKFEKYVVRRRVGTGMICAKIQFQYGVPAVPHLLCQGFTREETEDHLVELDYAGIRTVLALRGDDLKFKKVIPENRSQNEYAVDLVRQIKQMNQGTYLHREGHKTDFCVGVAGYPEKHFQAPNKKEDIRRLKEKVDAGADYIVTQMFFDNQRFYDWVDQVRSAGIEVPIIPGLKIFTRRSQLQKLPSIFHFDYPEEFTDGLAALPNKKGAVGDFGIDWAQRQVEDLFAHPEYFPDGKLIAHFYVLGKAGPVKKLMGRLGPLEPYLKD